MWPKVLSGLAFASSVQLIALFVGVASVCFGTSARAALQVTASSEADHHLVLSQQPASIQAELVGLAENDVPVFDTAQCANLGGRLIERARSRAMTMDVIVARYNLVNVWTGNLCAGKTDVMPASGEATSWLEELAGLSRTEDGAGFIDARKRLAEVLVFGAPGVSSDLRRAQEYLVEEARRDSGMLLYSAYMAERGLVGAPDRDRALALIRQAAERGNEDGEALLAQAYELGLGVARDEAGAFARYERLSKKVRPTVWFRIGLMLLDGRGTKADPCRAKKFLELATHGWTPIPAAKEYLSKIGDQVRCPAPG